MRRCVKPKLLGVGALFWIVLAVSCALGEDPELVVTDTTQTSSQRSEGSGPALDRGTAFFSVGEHEIVINYGRPTLDGQDMLSRIKPGTLWRLGMNEATEIESTSDLVFGETTVPAGRYTIFARYHAAQSWELVFNQETGQWGAFEHDPQQDVAKVPLSLSEIQESVERLTIGLEPTSDRTGRLTIRWGHKQLAADFQVG